MLSTLKDGVLLKYKKYKAKTIKSELAIGATLNPP
jgi:hypothetical protein